MKFKKFIKQIKEIIEKNENNRLSDLLKKEEEKLNGVKLERKVLQIIIHKSAYFKPIKTKTDYIEAMLKIRRELEEKANEELLAESVNTEVSVLSRDHYISFESETDLELSFEITFQKMESLEEAKKRVLNQIKKELKEKKEDNSSLIKLEVVETDKELQREKKSGIISFKQRVLTVSFVDVDGTEISKKFELNFLPLTNENDLKKLLEKNSEIVEIKS